jgi:hypothetical protein
VTATITIRIHRTLGSTAPLAVDRGPEWMTDPRRACSPERAEHPEIWTSENVAEQNRAAQACREKCPFQAQCRAWAEEKKEPFHVWGGTVRGRKPRPVAVAA